MDPGRLVREPCGNEQPEGAGRLGVRAAWAEFGAWRPGGYCASRTGPVHRTTAVLEKYRRVV